MDRQTKREQKKPVRLARWTRSVWHPQLLWFSAGGGAAVALAVPLASLLAAAEPGSTERSAHEWWTWAVVVVVFAAIVALVICVVCGVGAVLTRPVRDNHAGTLRASARSLLRSLESGSSDYGSDGYRPEAAFDAHFGRLTGRLRRWDELRSDAGEAQRRLEDHVASAMQAQGITEVYNIRAIRTYTHDLALRHARGSAPQPPEFDWWRNRGTTAIVPEAAPIPGPPEGWMRPYDGAQIWISLSPLDGETESEWKMRVGSYTERADVFVKVVHMSALPLAEAAVEAERRVTDFKRDELPAVAAALLLIQEREPPRWRPFRCESC